MSPRSREFLDSAGEAIKGARASLTAGAPARALSSAYYAMLYAARAALSEEDEHARTHRGTWHLFRERFVRTGRFDESLFEAAQSAQRARERGDYEAEPPALQIAAACCAQAERFLAEVTRMLGE